MNRIFFTIVLLLIPGFAVRGEGSGIPVVPAPREVIPGKDFFRVEGGSISVRISGMEGPSAGVVREQLKEALQERFGSVTEYRHEGDPDIWIGIPEADGDLRALARKKQLQPGPELGTEGYLLRIEKRNIYILANSEAGAFYGVQTLRQLFRGYRDPGGIPGLTVRDWPDIAFRCVMDDISRGPVPTDEYLRLQVRRYAEMKINHMSFYIEHVIRTEKYPDLAPAGGGISVEAFRELSEYAAGYHIQLVGNFQSLGHFEKILSLPQFRHLGATDRMLDPTNPDAITFLGDIYREMAPAFSSAVFTPNLDEAWDLTRGGLAGIADGPGPARIYADHVNRIDSVLSLLGKQTLIWGDIILEHPGILTMLPEHIMLGAWDYSASESFAAFIDPLKEAGFRFTVSPGVLNSNRLIPDFDMTMVNIRNFINEGYRKGAAGVYCTVWDDGGIHFFTHDWYGVAYNAEQSWRPNSDPLEEFDMRFSRGIYGDADNLVPRTLHALNRLTGLAPTYEMNSDVFWKTLVPERGGKVTFDPSGWTEVMQRAGEAAGILEGASTPFYGGDLRFIRFTTEQYRFMAGAREELLQASRHYANACGLQREDRSSALAELERASGLIGELRQWYGGLVEEFSLLWDMESRPYWKDRAFLQFRGHLDGFNDQIALLGKAAEEFREGAFLPPPSEVRLDIREHAGQFFQYWLMTGSFPIAVFEEVTPDFLGSMGGEAGARPFPGQTFAGPDGETYLWEKFDSPLAGEIDLLPVFEPNTQAVAYAYCTIVSPDTRRVTALLGSNDGATVWCNGKEVHHIHAKRSVIPDEDRFDLELEKGNNHVLIKVEQWKGGWGFAFRLEDAEVRNHKQKYYIQ